MPTGIGYDKCLSFINCQIAPGKTLQSSRNGVTRYRAVTVSRQTGSGSHAIAEHLAARLQTDTPRTARPWTVFDKDLVNQVLKDHDLPERMADCIPEDRRTELQDAVEELFGLRPPSWTLIQHTTETILKLVELGNVILIGRGATVVTESHPEVLRVRFVASEPSRAARIAETQKLSRNAALELIRKEDRARVRYVKKYFDADTDDAELYHLTLNTDLIPQDQIVGILKDLIRGVTSKT